ncbi:MAG: putative ATP-dependent endonuclease of the family [Thermomicrobiales bacterium]|jgi:predicted ATPase|nr:putative ATP-dependent endonuclease of the family [Thermomicrobiales bacterium]
MIAPTAVVDISNMASAPVPSPLWLSEVSVRRFRSLYEIGPIRLQDGLTVLAGQNDGGKSTLFDAIAFLLGGYQSDVADRSYDIANNELIEVEGVFYSLFDLDRVSPIRIRATQPLNGPRSLSVLGHVHPLIGGRLQVMTVDQLRTAHKMVLGSSGSGLNKADLKQVLDDWLSTRPLDEFEECWAPARDELAHLPKLTWFSSATAQDPVAAVQHVVAKESQRILSGENFIDQLADLSEAIDRDVDPSLTEIRSQIRKHCPDLDSVSIEASFDFTRVSPRITMRVTRKGKEVDLKKHGQGQVRRVTLAIHEGNLNLLKAEGTSQTEILLYDEPDTHLDYAAQRTLFGILNGQSQLTHVQVLVATHSKNFIDMAPLEAIHHFRLNADLWTEVEQLVGRSHEQELEFQASLFSGLGLRNSMILDERCFLVVEGETEESALPVLFNRVMGRSLVSLGIHIVNTSGSGSNRNFVKMLKTKWRKDVVLYADSDIKNDQKTLAWIQDLGLVEGSDAHFIGANEFEDAFADEVWLEVLQLRFPPTAGQPDWTPDDVAGFRTASKFSEELHNTVRRRHRNSSVGKPDLGIALAEVCLTSPSNIPDELVKCFEALSQIARR